MIGWAAINGDISLQSFSLFAIIFMWTPPHSWALALFRMEDYRNCRVPMMPVVKGQLYTKKQIFLYSVLMIITALSPYMLGMCNGNYLIISLILGIGFMFYVIKLFNDNHNKYAKKLFWYSIFYLFSIFLSLLMFKI